MPTDLVFLEVDGFDLFLQEVRNKNRPGQRAADCVGRMPTVWKSDWQA
ncbi:MAG: hypothetical protein JNL98_10050 [Bryobacterales bacterium]|nr:hypothetical protein [Bryobacterales bacterium]